MTNKTRSNHRPTVEDVLRACGYLLLAVWAVFFGLFPPTPYATQLVEATLFAWLAVSALGALTAMVGALTRIDIKMELPGLLLALVGPLFYALIKVLDAAISGAGSYLSSIHIFVYAILPLVLLLPRANWLRTEATRLRKVHRSRGAGLS